MHRVYNITNLTKEEKIMKDILNKIEIVLTDMWNYLYRFLAHIFGENVNDDWMVEPPING